MILRKAWQFKPTTLMAISFRLSKNTTASVIKTDFSSFLLQNSPEVDEEGYSMRPDEEEEDIL